MLINWSFYDNQEAMERNFLALCIPALLGGYGMIVILFLYTALQSEDEDRFYEEMNLDTGELGIHYALNLQKEKIENYYQAHNRGYFAKGEDIFHDYLTDDFIFERDMLAEIYEFPISTIISNNYYLVPSDERSFIYFQELLRQRFLENQTKVGLFLSTAKRTPF